MLEPELWSDGTSVTQLQLLQLGAVISVSKQLKHMGAGKMFVMLLAERSCDEIHDAGRGCVALKESTWNLCSIKNYVYLPR